jgi:glycosyltransferase involved in cell wall biosynthesis
MRRRAIYLQYTNPAAYPPLEHSSRLLAREGWQVLFLGTVADGAALHFPSHCNIVLRLLRLCPAGWRQKLHYAWFALWVFAWVVRWRPTWVYASDPLSCPIALVLSYLPGLRMVYHEHDSPNTSNAHETCQVSKFLRFVLWARRRLAQRTQLCILPNEHRAERFAVELGNECTAFCVWNTPSLDEVKPSRQPRATQLIVYYHGNIGPSYLPCTVFKALAMLPSEVSLRVVGYETISTQRYVQHLRDEARRLGIEGRIEFMDAIPRYQLFEQCYQCDIGLAFIPLNDSDINNLAMAGASNKPFDYLACGLPLLVSDLSDWREMYVTPGYGLACNPEDPESIAAALHWFLEHPAEMRAMGEWGRQRILAEWNYERQFAPVLERLNGTKSCP